MVNHDTKGRRLLNTKVLSCTMSQSFNGFVERVKDEDPEHPYPI